MVTNKTLCNVLMRTFFLQSTWNFERMQNLGFCYAILPALREIYNKEDELQDALKRHVEFFNTHPYMASAIIGTVIGMEEDVKNGNVSGDEVKTLKTAVMGSCGAMGDSFFWGVLKPFASIVSVLLAAFGQIIAPLIFLLLYNIPHMAIKIFGLYDGCREGMQVFDRFKTLNLHVLARRVKFLGVILAGLLMAVLCHSRHDPQFSAGTVITGVTTLLFFFICYGLIKKGMSIQGIIYTVLILSIGSSALI